MPSSNLSLCLQEAIRFPSENPIASAVVILSLFVLCRFLFSLYLHPLSKFPGSRWAAATNLYNTWLFGTNKSHFKMLDLHKKYGPFVRIAPNMVSFSDPLLLPQVYHLRADKTPFYSTGIAGEVPPLLQIKGDAEHANKLRVLNPSYSLKHLQLQEDEIDSHIHRTCTVLNVRFAATGKSLDFAEWVRYFVYDSLIAFIYGKPLGMVEEGKDLHGLIREWHAIFPLGGMVSTLPSIVHPLITSRFLKKYLMPRKGHTRGSGHIMSVHEKLFRERLTQPQLSRPGNVFDSVRQTKFLDGRQMTLDEAERECFLVTVGGQDTSPAFISAFFELLLSNPRVYAKLVEEIDAFEIEGKLSSPVPRYDETCAMPYFMACVQEALRLEPSASLILPRYAPKGGIQLGGHWVPENTEIAANPYVIHRNQDVFGPDAEMFRPERWLEDPARRKMMTKYSLAFGYGSRKCLGKNIALFVSQKLCTQLLRQFTMSRADLQYPTVLNWGLNVYFGQNICLEARTPSQG